MLCSLLEVVLCTLKFVFRCSSLWLELDSGFLVKWVAKCALGSDYMSYMYSKGYVTDWGMWQTGVCERLGWDRWAHSWQHLVCNLKLVICVISYSLLLLHQLSMLPASSSIHVSVANLLVWDLEWYISDNEPFCSIIILLPFYIYIPIMYAWFMEFILVIYDFVNINHYVTLSVIGWMYIVWGLIY